MNEEAIEALRQKEQEVDHIEHRAGLEAWKSSVHALVRVLFPKFEDQQRQIAEIQYEQYPMAVVGDGPIIGGGDNLDECRQRARGLVQAFLEEVAILSSSPRPETDETEPRSQGSRQRIKRAAQILGVIGSIASIVGLCLVFFL